MTKSTFRGSLIAGLLAAIAICAAPAGAQTKAAAPATATVPTAPAAAEKAPMNVPKKRRVARKSMALGCEPVNDPWQNLCKIRKNAEVACSDLGAPTRAKASRNVRKGVATAAQRNMRQDCVNAYMRNV